MKRLCTNPSLNKSVGVALKTRVRGHLCELEAIRIKKNDENLAQIFFYFEFRLFQHTPKYISDCYDFQYSESSYTYAFVLNFRSVKCLKLQALEVVAGHGEKTLTFKDSMKHKSDFSLN